VQGCPRRDLLGLGARMWWCCKTPQNTPNSCSKLTTARQDVYQGVCRVDRTWWVCASVRWRNSSKPKSPTKVGVKPRTAPRAVGFALQDQPTPIPSLQHESHDRYQVGSSVRGVQIWLLQLGAKGFHHRIQDRSHVSRRIKGSLRSVFLVTKTLFVYLAK
jgi:hypothetical protein